MRRSVRAKFCWNSFSSNGFRGTSLTHVTGGPRRTQRYELGIIIDIPINFLAITIRLDKLLRAMHGFQLFTCTLLRHLELVDAKISLRYRPT